MKVNSKILHLPPYLSTTWNFVRTLYLRGSNLVICLTTGIDVEVPGLQLDTLDLIFSAHSNFLEGNHPHLQGLGEQTPPLQMSLVKHPPLFTEARRLPDAEGDSSLTFGLGAFDSLGSALHHNASQSNMPDIPEDILQKISAIAKIVAPDDVQVLPKAEPHCNCAHCQIARAVQKGLGCEDENPEGRAKQEPVEEEVTDAELCFQQWEIIQTGDMLYSCSNRLDSKEKYSVYLGNPVGCTCGKQGCEHILAVLKS